MLVPGKPLAFLLSSMVCKDDRMMMPATQIIDASLSDSDG